MSKEQSFQTKAAGVLIMLMGFLFIALKCMEVTAVATWSWWWVTAPFWAPTVVGLAVFLVVFLVAMVVEMCKGAK